MADTWPVAGQTMGGVPGPGMPRPMGAPTSMPGKGAIDPEQMKKLQQYAAMQQVMGGMGMGGQQQRAAGPGVNFQSMQMPQGGRGLGSVQLAPLVQSMYQQRLGR